jgi:fermentation-respiration switch protein FrsA (DUF1100 family)
MFTRAKLKIGFKSTAKCLLLAALTACFALGGCTVVVDERSLLHPVKAGALDPARLAGPAASYSVTQVWIDRPDGARLHAVHLRQAGARATVLYFGGNGYVIGRHGAWTANLFARLGVDMMIVDHRGYGLSSGAPKISAGEADGLAAYDHLAAVTRGPIVVHGHSLGSFIAGHVAAHRNTAAAVLESSASTTEDWVAARTGGLTRALLKVKIDEGLKGRGNMRNIVDIDEPLLLIVGARDKTTPPWLSQKLFTASPLMGKRKQLVVVRNAGHDDGMNGREAHEAYDRLLTSLGGG